MEIITTHRNTDFDAFASVFAASLVYPEAVPVIPNSLNANIHGFLSIHKDQFSYKSPKEIDFDEISRLIVVDTNEWERLEGVNILSKREDLEVHLWDHHGDGGNINAKPAYRKKIGATTTIFVNSMREKLEGISPIEATLFLAGIYEDTGNLTFPGTCGDDARAAGFLLDIGADLSMIRNFLRPSYGPLQKEMLFRMLKHAERTKLNGYTVSINRQDIDRHTPGLSLVVEMYLNIMNVDAAFGLFWDQKKEKCIVIGRSVSESLDLGILMQSLGGGGHPGAGSALLKNIRPESVEASIMNLISGDQQSSVQISDLMSFPVFSISSKTTMQEAALLFRDKGCTGFPVTENDQLVGVISRRDFKKVKKDSQMKSPVKAFMANKVVQISPESSVTQAARIMVKNDIGRLPVVEDGRMIGIITRSDTLRYYYNLLPD